MTDLDQILSGTVQSQAKKEPLGGISWFNYLVNAGSRLPPWWSFSRDIELRKFVQRSDHLSGAMYSMEAKMTAIPFKIVARDQSNRRDVIEAERETDNLFNYAQFMGGWPLFFGKCVQDLTGTDNGFFAEIIGAGRKDQPLVGRPWSIAHLDSTRCRRTGNAIFPVVYQDTDGKLYKLHYTRLIMSSQMPSAIAEMFNVGFCSVSRCVNNAQVLADILTFKQEKMGSRPHRAILITQGGLDPDDISSAFQLAESQMNDQGLSRYARMVVVGSSSLQNSNIEKVELSSLPDGFDEEQSTIFGMACIALAFGVDARELFPAMQTGATRADALLQHLKQRGKGPGQIIQVIETEFNKKYLPPYLKMVFDFQDDAQDRQVADIRMVRANRRAMDINSRSIPARIIREQMVIDGDLTREQFERVELMDGRLPTGASVLTLFYSTEPRYQKYLDLGVDDPLDMEANDINAMNALIHEKSVEAMKVLAKGPGSQAYDDAFYAMMALIFLEKQYQEPDTAVKIMLGEDVPASGSMGMFANGQDKRVRNIDLTNPSSPDVNPQTNASTMPGAHPDDSVTAGQ